jgi:hypothetical protein
MVSTPLLKDQVALVPQDPLVALRASLEERALPSMMISSWADTSSAEEIISSGTSVNSVAWTVVVGSMLIAITKASRNANNRFILAIPFFQVASGDAVFFIEDNRQLFYDIII